MRKFQLKLIDRRMADFIPTYGSDGAAAIDLRACLAHDVQSVVIQPNEVKMIGTGIAIHIEDSEVAGLILPRSGLGAKHGIILGNGTGLIDSDYQGELKLSIWNRSKEAFKIEHNDRIAQYMLVPVIRGQFEVVEEFNANTHRGNGGFGHTGKK
jgi:dUTP pyrophosphatase